MPDREQLLHTLQQDAVRALDCIARVDGVVVDAVLDLGAWVRAQVACTV
jgi:hypothetical protein